MDSFCLQDWITIRGGVVTVTQGEIDWLDLNGYQDAILFLDVREASGTPTITFQTSPSKDEALCFSMITGTLMSAASSVATPIKATMSNAIVPLARFVRWQINGTVTWDATFRVWVAANSPGRRGASSSTAANRDEPTKGSVPLHIQSPVTTSVGLWTGQPAKGRIGGPYVSYLRYAVKGNPFTGK